MTEPKYDSWRLEIPWCPPSLNVWMRSHFAKRSRILWDAGTIIKPYVQIVQRDLGIKGPVPFKLEMEFQIFAKSRRDDDNCVVGRKCCLDIFQRIGFLKNDDPDHVRSIDLPCKVDRKNPRTVIRIRRAE